MAVSVCSAMEKKIMNNQQSCQVVIFNNRYASFFNNQSDIVTNIEVILPWINRPVFRVDLFTRPTPYTLMY